MKIHLINQVTMPMSELWRTLHTPDFDAYLAKGYGLEAYRELEKEISGTLSRRRVLIICGKGFLDTLPAPVRKIIGVDQIIYEEVQTKSLDRYEMYFKNKIIEPSWCRDIYRISGQMRLAPVDEDRCNCIRNISINIRGFAIGRLLEIAAAKQMKKSSDTFPFIVDKWRSARMGGGDSPK